MKTILSLVMLAVACVCRGQVETGGNEWKERLMNGDLIFNIHTKSSAFGDAIVSATSAEGVSISHVAIYMADSVGGRVIEATGRYGVRICPLDSFVVRAEHSSDGKPMLLFGRLKDRSCADAAVERAKTYLGRPYDWLFSDTEEAIYCSELVHFSYIGADGEFVFEQQPMSFHDVSGQILPYWTEYYRKRGLEVPEGAPGTNPKGIYDSERISVFTVF